MKKIANLLIVAVIAMMTLTTACSGAKDKALSVAVEQINEQLKGQKMPEGYRHQPGFQQGLHRSGEIR